MKKGFVQNVVDYNKRRFFYKLVSFIVGILFIIETVALFSLTIDIVTYIILLIVDVIVFILLMYAFTRRRCEEK